MKKLTLGIIIAFGLTICGILFLKNTPPNYSLPKDAPSFTQFEFSNPSTPEDTYMAIAYNGRTYLPYGTLGKRIRRSGVDTCIGYLNDDTSIRLFLLREDIHQTYIMEISTNGFMEQPFFYRATDTKGQTVPAFDFIQSLEYDYWK